MVNRLRAQATERSQRPRKPWRPALNAVLGGAISLALVLSLGFPVHAADLPNVTFSLDFPGSDPDRYSISVTSDSRAHYECSGKISADSEDRETYETDFDFTDATRARVFSLAARANYFSGKIDSGNKKLAFTGAKKLTFKDGEHSSSAEYNYSTLPPIQELTDLFQNVAATLEFGRRLSHYHRYQKLALDEELKRMEDEVRRGSLIELQAVKPILQEIYDDPSVINMVRARAQQIMAQGATGKGAK